MSVRSSRKSMKELRKDVSIRLRIHFDHVRVEAYEDPEPPKKGSIYKAMETLQSQKSKCFCEKYNMNLVICEGHTNIHLETNLAILKENTVGLS